MSDQRSTTQAVSMTKKQRVREYFLGFSIGLLPLLLELWIIIAPCDAPIEHLWYVGSLCLLVELVAIYIFMWFPRSQVIGTGLFSSMFIALLLILPVFNVYWDSCAHFSF